MSLREFMPRNVRSLALAALAACGSFGCTAPEQEDEPVAASTREALTGIDAVWQAQGPTPTQNGQVENLSPNNAVAGAIHTLVPHPTDANILYAGGVNGGVWRTNDATSVSPTWTPLTDFFGSLSISALAMDPTDSDVLLAGIGNYSSFGASGAFTGLMLTTDGGANFTQLADPLLPGDNFSGVTIRGNIVLASSNLAVYRSINGGTSFTLLSGAVGTGLPFGSAFDLVSDPSNGSRYYVTIGTQGLFRSDNDGATWVNVSQNDPTGLQPAIASLAANNAEMAVGSDGLVFVTVMISGQPNYIGFSADQGTTWTQMDLPNFPQTGVINNVVNASNTTPIVITLAANHGLPANEPGLQVNISGVLGNTAANGTFSIVTIAATDPPNQFTLAGSSGNGAYAGGGSWQAFSGVSPRPKPGSQGATHLAVAVNPADSTMVFLCGDRQVLPSFLGATQFDAACVRGDTTVAPTGGLPSPQWEHLGHSNAIAAVPGGGTASSSAPHADAREMAFDANGDLIESDDGGINRRTSPGDNTGDWTSIVGNIQVAEFHAIAYDPVSQVIFGGAQDTGVPAQITGGSAAWTSLTTADGGDVQVDSTTSPGQSIRYFSNQFLINVRRVTFDAASNPVATAFLGLNAGAGTPISPQFYTPIELNQNTPTRIVLAGTNAVYESTDQGDNITSLNAGANAVGMAYGNPDNVEALYVAGFFGVLVRTTAGGALAATTFPGPATDVTMDPADFNHAFAISGTQVFETANAGGLWTNVTGDLAQLAPGTLRQVLFVPGGAVDKVVVAADLGVFVSADNAPGFWNELGSNLPNALAMDLDFDAARDFLVVGTLGRGAFSLSPFTTVDLPPAAVCQNVTVPANAQCQGSASAAQVDGGSFDPEGGAVTLNLVPPGPFVLGPNTVTLEVTDAAGQTETCTAIVTVIDVTPPVLNCPVSVNVNCVNANGATASFATSASDNCGSAGTPVCAPPSGSNFPLGTTVDVCTSTDGSGNVGSCSFNVTVALADNPVCCPAGTNVILGNSNNNTLNGTSGSDCILGRGAQDTINGSGGNDFISGGDGDDIINCGLGNDLAFGGTGQDRLNGEGGNDVMSGGDGDDICGGGDGNDHILGGQGQDRLNGDGGDDRLVGETGDDRLEGGNGDDVLVGGGLHDICIGGAGTDSFLTCEQQTQ
jgi:Ca2+-binding RTX toxin-like protein